THLVGCFEASLVECTRTGLIALSERHVRHLRKNISGLPVIGKLLGDLQALTEKRSSLGVGALKLGEPAHAFEDAADQPAIVQPSSHLQALAEQRPRPWILAELAGED